MAEPEVRGIWNVDEGVAHQWDLYNLSSEFQDEGLGNKNYTILNKDEAQPSPPGPYCVYTLSTPIVLNHMSGLHNDTVSTENQLSQVTLTFMIHAKDTNDESGYEVCKRLMKKVVNAFDPRRKLPLQDDRHVSTIRQGGAINRVGEEEWRATLAYELTIDSTYAQF
jgi:hypothetical protein